MKNKIYSLFIILICGYNFSYSQICSGCTDIFSPNDENKYQWASYNKINILTDSILQSPLIGLFQQAETLYAHSPNPISIHHNIGTLRQLKKVVFHDMDRLLLPVSFRQLDSLKNIYIGNISEISISEVLPLLNPTLHLNNLEFFGCDMNNIAQLPTFAGQIDSLWVGCDADYGEPEKTGFNATNISHIVRIFHPKVLAIKQIVPSNILCEEPTNINTLMLVVSTSEESIFTNEICSLGHIPNLILHYEQENKLFEGKTTFPFVDTLTLHLGWGDSLNFHFNMPNLTKLTLYTCECEVIGNITGAQNIKEIHICAYNIKSFGGLTAFEKVEKMTLKIGEEAYLPHVLEVLESLKSLKKCLIQVKKGNRYATEYKGKFELEYFDTWNEE